MNAVSPSPAVEIEIDDKVVRVSNPDRVYFPARGETKLDLVEYYLSVGDGIVNALRERPCMLHRFPTGVTGEKVHQKRLPKGAPPWMETVQVFFPRWKRTADELCVTELAQVIALVPAGIALHPELPGERDQPVLRGPDPLPTELDDGAVLEPVVERAPPDPVLRLEDDHPQIPPAQLPRGGQAGEPGSDDRDVDLVGWHGASLTGGRARTLRHPARELAGDQQPDVGVDPETEVR